MFNNGSRLSKRKTVQLMVVLTILAWATQTLVHQWGYGQEIGAVAVAADDVGTAGAADSSPAGAEPEKFVPPAADAAAGTLELKSEAIVHGDQVKLKQICRWADADSGLFAPAADLVVAHLPGETPSRSLSVDDIRQTLRDAGLNVALVSFAGATQCKVVRDDASSNQAQPLQQWIQTHRDSVKADEVAKPAAEGAASATQPANAKPSLVPARPGAGQDKGPLKIPGIPDDPYRSLREVVIDDLCQRLRVQRDSLQMSFNSRDDRLLNLAEPVFHFSIVSRRVPNLGEVAWQVKVVTDDGTTQQISIDGMAQMWKTQTVVVRPLAAKQLITDVDVAEQRVLLDRLPDETLLKKSEAVAELAARDLKPGTVLTAHMVDPVFLVRPGDLVTVSLRQGTVQIRGVAKALEGGSLGQIIKVRNETTRDIFEVTINGPQETTLGPTGGAEANGGN